jgi:hypothetical protein
MACVGVLVIAALAWAAVTTSKAPQIDGNLCHRSGATAVTAILIDATDPISAIQKAAVTTRLNRVLRELSANERLDIYEISPVGDPLKPKFSMCRPVSAAEVSELTGNKRLANERFEKRFKPAVADALNALLTTASADRSPIMESIQSAAVVSLQAVELKPDAHKRLVIVSDMLENGAAGSHYGAPPDFEAYRKTSVYPRFVADLTDVDVTVLYLRRDDGAEVQGKPHIDFWTRWFAAQGATLVNAVPIEG